MHREDRGTAVLVEDLFFVTLFVMALVVFIVDTK
jgi:hypothetical protein